MPAEPIEIIDLDDARLGPYVNVRHTNHTRHSGRFIAEGRLVVERLVASDYAVESVLVEKGHRPAWLDSVADETPVFCLPRASLEQVVGFNFHRGVMACGVRKPLLPVESLDWNHVPLAVAAVGVTEPENLGSILRSSAALGVNHVLLGPGTADPFSRRVLRVSMATALKHHFYDLSHPVETIAAWDRECAARVLATALAPQAVAIDQLQRDERPILLLMGNEAHGLSTEVINAASDCVTIPMRLGTDSLNVAVATAMFLYELTRGTNIDRETATDALRGA